MEKISVFAPASVANVCAGYDVLGFSFAAVGDHMHFEKTPAKGVRISEITGAELPLTLEDNVAGVAVKALYNRFETQIDFGIDIRIEKKIKPGSGIGSSAASAAGAIFGADALLNSQLSSTELISLAMKGEAVASGCEHADNVAPSLLGGFSLISSYHPLTVSSIYCDLDLHAVVLHPKIEVKTKEARAVLPSKIPLTLATEQWGHLAGLILGLTRSDAELISRHLTDLVIEPHRKKLIPKFEQYKSAALDEKALGFGISGSGPSVFALCEGSQNAEQIKANMMQIASAQDYDFSLYSGEIDNKGTHEIR